MEKPTGCLAINAIITVVAVATTLRKYTDIHPAIRLVIGLVVAIVYFILCNIKYVRIVIAIGFSVFWAVSVIDVLEMFMIKLDDTWKWVIIVISFILFLLAQLATVGISGNNLGDDYTVVVSHNYSIFDQARSSELQDFLIDRITCFDIRTQSFTTQIEALKSQKKYDKYLKTKHMILNTNLNAYSTQCEQIIRDYQNNQISFDTAISKIKTKLEKYENELNEFQILLDKYFEK